MGDGLGCFGGLAEAGLKHKAVLTGSGRPKDARLKWTDTGLGNIKCAIAGTCRSFDPQHTERYLASYEWRFNRRFDLDKNVERLARIAAQAAPTPFLDDKRNIVLVGGTGPGKSNIAIGLARNIMGW